VCFFNIFLHKKTHGPTEQNRDPNVYVVNWISTKIPRMEKEKFPQQIVLRKCIHMHNKEIRTSLSTACKNQLNNKLNIAPRTV
jgi:hypothetical protein